MKYMNKLNLLILYQQKLTDFSYKIHFMYIIIDVTVT